MKTEADLKSKLVRHFHTDERSRYLANLQWLKWAQAQSEDIYRKKYELQLKHADDKRFRVCPYLRDSVPVFLGYLYEQCYLKPQIRRAGRTLSLKVSGKIASEFQGSFVYEPQTRAYYKLGETLGRGSCGKGPDKVKKAINIDTYRQVAIKILRGSSNDLEIEILKLLNRFKGSMLVPSMKYGLINQYIIQTLVTGKSLFDLAKKELELDTKQINEIIQQCFVKLKEYHGLGIILDDVKEDNILFDSFDNQVQFVDFGHSKLISRDSSGNISMSYDDGKKTESQTIDKTQLIELKNKDIKNMHGVLKDLFSKLLSPAQVKTLDELKERHLISELPGQEAKPTRFN